MSDSRGSLRIVDVFDAPREAVFAAWTEPERLKQWWGPGWVEGVPDTRESLVTVEFREDGARTQVVLVHDNFVGPGPIDMYDEGWRSGLAKLRAFLRPKETTDAQSL